MKPHTAFLLGALLSELFMFHIDSVSAALNNLECCGRAARGKQRRDLLNPTAKHSPQLPASWRKESTRTPSAACPVVELQG